jgi:hypothetical protein
LDLDGRESHFYLIKCTRSIIGFSIFDIRKIMTSIRKAYKRKLEFVIKNDPLMAQNKLIDQNQLTDQVLMKFTVKVIKLGLIIMNICYFLGLFWYIMSELIVESKNHDPNDPSLNIDSFIDYYELRGNSP